MTLPFPHYSLVIPTSTSQILPVVKKQLAFLLKCALCTTKCPTESSAGKQSPEISGRIWHVTRLTLQSFLNWFSDKLYTGLFCWSHKNYHQLNRKFFWKFGFYVNLNLSSHKLAIIMLMWNFLVEFSLGV